MRPELLEHAATLVVHDRLHDGWHAGVAWVRAALCFFEGSSFVERADLGAELARRSERLA